MERRTTKVIISSAGGTAGKGARTCKVALPTAWMEKMGIDAAQREVELTFDGTKVSLSRRLSGPEYAKDRRALGNT